MKILLLSWILLSNFLLIEKVAGHNDGSRTDDTTTTSCTEEGSSTTSRRASSSGSNIDIVNMNNIFKGVINHLDDVINLPHQVVKIMKNYHDDGGFRPYGLHAQSRDRILTYMFSLIKSYNYQVQIYFGTESGEYFTHFKGITGYREPGNSGYLINTTQPQPQSSSNSTLSELYYDVCIDGFDGTQRNCTMDVGNEYVQCINDCQLIKCPTNNNDENNEKESHQEEDNNNIDNNDIKWCPNYTIEQVKENDEHTRGYVPIGYFCIDQQGLFTQTPGEVLKSDINPNNGRYGQYYKGNCLYDDGITSVTTTTTTTTRERKRKFPSCINNNNSDDDGLNICDAYIGLRSTQNYDPRIRPWYIETKHKQVNFWSEPYPFWTYDAIRVGITYTHPFYIYNKDWNKTIFDGVFAVDYSVFDITNFLVDNYGYDNDDDNDDDVGLLLGTYVMVFEESEPYRLIGVSDNIIDPYQQVLIKDNTILCDDDDPNINIQEDCTYVRISALDLHINSNLHIHKMASLATKVQADLNFPEGEIVTVKIMDDEDDDDDAGDDDSSNNDDRNIINSAAKTKPYFSQSAKYSAENLEWIVLVVSPMEQATSDTVQRGDILFVVLILVATAGFVGCCIFLGLWYLNRNKTSVMQGDFKFTFAFICGCIVLNLSSFTALGANTDPMCLLRYWSMNLAFSLAIAPLFAKVYRMWLLIGSAHTYRRKKIDVKRTSLLAIPIIGFQVLILFIFHLVDPPRAVETVDLESGEPILHITCEHETRGFFFTQTIYDALLVGVGCALSYMSRNLDMKYGEAKQLIFGMYNVALTGVCFICLVSVASITPAALHTFRTIAIFWGTVLTCAVFCLPRVFRKNDRSRRYTISGLNDPSASIQMVPQGGASASMMWPQPNTSHMSKKDQPSTFSSSYGSGSSSLKGQKISALEQAPAACERIAEPMGRSISLLEQAPTVCGRISEPMDDPSEKAPEPLRSEIESEFEEGKVYNA